MYTYLFPVSFATHRCSIIPFQIYYAVFSTCSSFHPAKLSKYVRKYIKTTPAWTIEGEARSPRYFTPQDTRYLSSCISQRSSSFIILASLNSAPLHLVGETLSIFTGLPRAPFCRKTQGESNGGRWNVSTRVGHVIYATDTVKPVYANIIAVELVWQHARSRVLLNLATTTRISGALVSVYRREYHREYTCSLKFSSGERFKVPVQRQIIRTDVFWHVIVDVSRHRTGRIRDWSPRRLVIGDQSIFNELSFSLNSWENRENTLAFLKSWIVKLIITWICSLNYFTAFWNNSVYFVKCNIWLSISFPTFVRRF